MGRQREQFASEQISRTFKSAEGQAERTRLRRDRWWFRSATIIEKGHSFINSGVGEWLPIPGVATAIALSIVTGNPFFSAAAVGLGAEAGGEAVVGGPHRRKRQANRAVRRLERLSHTARFGREHKQVRNLTTVFKAQEAFVAEHKIREWIQTPDNNDRRSKAIQFVFEREKKRLAQEQEKKQKKGKEALTPEAQEERAKEKVLELVSKAELKAQSQLGNWFREASPMLAALGLLGLTVFINIAGGFVVGLIGGVSIALLKPAALFLQHYLVPILQAADDVPIIGKGIRELWRIGKLIFRRN